MCLQHKSFENTVGKREIAHNEQFLLFPQCFLPFWKSFCHFIKFKIILCELFKFGRILNSLIKNGLLLIHDCEIACVIYVSQKWICNSFPDDKF